MGLALDLGNNFATTEREIVEMALRIAGAGRHAIEAGENHLLDGVRHANAIDI